MNIQDHGIWARYTPTTLPEGAPTFAMFTHRVSDGVDWYDYVNSGEHFAEASVKLTLRPDNIVGAAVFDPTRLFPGDGGVLEIHDATTDDPQAAFGGKLYDPTSNTFKDPPPPVMPPDPLVDLLARLEALEGKG